MIESKLLDKAGYALGRDRLPTRRLELCDVSSEQEFVCLKCFIQCLVLFISPPILLLPNKQESDRQNTKLEASKRHSIDQLGVSPSSA